MSLIETLSGHHLLNVEIQPDETYFLKILEAGEVEKLDGVLGAFQPGDTETIAEIMQDDVCDCEDPYCYKKTALLRRLQVAARAMEANDESTS